MSKSAHLSILYGPQGQMGVAQVTGNLLPCLQRLGGHGLCGSQAPLCRALGSLSVERACGVMPPL